MKYKVLFGLALLIVSNVYGKITEVGSNSSLTPTEISTIQDKDGISSAEEKSWFGKMVDSIKGWFSSREKNEEQTTSSASASFGPKDETELIEATFSSTNGDVPPISDTAQKLESSSEERPMIEEQSILTPYSMSPKTDGMELNPEDLTEVDSLSNRDIQEVEVNGKPELTSTEQEAPMSEGIIHESGVETPQPIDIPVTDVDAENAALLSTFQNTIPTTTETEPFMPSRQITSEEVDFVSETPMEGDLQTDSLHSISTISDYNPNASEIDTLQSSEIDATNQNMIDNRSFSEPLPEPGADDVTELQIDQEPVGMMPASVEENTISGTAEAPATETLTEISTPLESTETSGTFPVAQTSADEITILPEENQRVEEPELNPEELGNINDKSTISELGTNIGEFEGNNLPVLPEDSMMQEGEFGIPDSVTMNSSENENM